jgi:hypothetical protein
MDMLTSNRHFVVKSETQKVIPRCGDTIRGELTMLNVETEPLVIGGVPPTSFKRPGLFVVPPIGNHNLQEHQIPLGSSRRGGFRSSISFWCLASNLEVILAQLGLSLRLVCRRGLRVLPGIKLDWL